MRLRFEKRRFDRETFQRLWKREYCVDMQQRAKWHKRTCNIKPDQLVIVEEDKKKRHLWRIARVVRVEVNSRTGIVRKVWLTHGPNYALAEDGAVDKEATQQSKPFARHVHSLFPLEVSGISPRNEEATADPPNSA